MITIILALIALGSITLAIRGLRRATTPDAAYRSVAWCAVSMIVLTIAAILAVVT